MLAELVLHSVNNWRNHTLLGHCIVKCSFFLFAVTLYKGKAEEKIISSSTMPFLITTTAHEGERRKKETTIK
jgi:hypothetical protein